MTPAKARWLRKGDVVECGVWNDREGVVEGLWQGRVVVRVKHPIAVHHELGIELISVLVLDPDNITVIQRKSRRIKEK